VTCEGRRSPLRLQRPRHELFVEFRALRFVRHAIAYEAIVPWLGLAGTNDSGRTEKLHGGLGLPGAFRSVIVVNDGHGGQNMAPLGWPGKVQRSSWRRRMSVACVARQLGASGNLSQRCGSLPRAVGIIPHVLRVFRQDAGCFA
jgi:hypothetical protein